jgi:hypothetical protein
VVYITWHKISYVFTVMFTYNYEQMHLLINIDTDADRNMNVYLVRAQMSAAP